MAFFAWFVSSRTPSKIWARETQFWYTTLNTEYVSFCSGSRSTKTFKPKKNIPEGTHQYDLMKHAAATLGSGNLRLAVVLPDGEDLNEWVAVNSMSSLTVCFTNLVANLRRNLPTESICILFIYSCGLFQSN